jgi:hypothetical protein
MTKQNFKVFTLLIFLLTVLGIGALVFLPGDFFSQKNGETGQARVIIPQNVGSGGDPNGMIENQSLEEGSAARILFGENETVISIITRDFDGDSVEEQIIAYRNLQEFDTPIYVAYADTNSSGNYVRTWSAPTAASKPTSLILYSEDLIGDGGICALVSGMNGSGEQTLTVFRKNGPEDIQTDPFGKIAEFIIEGSISVQEVQRSQDYQQGVRGRSLTISTYGRDYESSNMLDQIETTYTYNPGNGLYEQSRMVKVPGRQIEQNRVGELLNAPGKFEEFVNGLWVREMIDGRQQYVYFNTARQEMIFYLDNKEEVFNWQESNPTRYGLHIIGRNISLSKLRCTTNIELESLESIRLRVFQDAYLRTGPSTVWDGSYRKVQTLETAVPAARVQPYLEGSYRNQDGGIVFSRDGSYELYGASSAFLHRGKYVFFTLGNDQMLELRPAEPENLARETLRVSQEGEAITLTRIRIGTRGIQELESPISMHRNAAGGQNVPVQPET